MTDTAPSLTTKRALLYLRVSSAQQADKDFDAEGYSIPAQREACQREAAKLGAEVADEYIDRASRPRPPTAQHSGPCLTE